MFSVYDPNRFLALDPEFFTVYIHVGVCVYTFTCYTAEFLNTDQVCFYNFVKGQLEKMGMIVPPEQFQNKAQLFYNWYFLLIIGLTLIIYLTPKLDTRRKRRKRRRAIQIPSYSVNLQSKNDQPKDFTYFSANRGSIVSNHELVPIQIHVLEDLVAGPSNARASLGQQNIVMVEALDNLEIIDIESVKHVNTSHVETVIQVNDIEDTSYDKITIQDNSIEDAPIDIEPVTPKYDNYLTPIRSTDANKMVAVNKYSSQINVINLAALFLIIFRVSMLIFVHNYNKDNLFYDIFQIGADLIPASCPALLILSSEPLYNYSKRQVIIFLKEKFPSLNFQS
jgi:hypothetical protein